MPLANMEEIYQAHARTVYKFLLSQCHDADLAEELTQETFYQAVRSIDRFNGSLVINGTVADVEAAMKDVLNVLENLLHFAPAVITKT